MWFVVGSAETGCGEGDLNPLAGLALLGNLGANVGACFILNRIADCRRENLQTVWSTERYFSESL